MIYVVECFVIYIKSAATLLLSFERKKEALYYISPIKLFNFVISISEVPIDYNRSIEYNTVTFRSKNAALSVKISKVK